MIWKKLLPIQEKNSENTEITGNFSQVDSEHLKPTANIITLSDKKSNT